MASNSESCGDRGWNKKGCKRVGAVPRRPYSGRHVGTIKLTAVNHVVPNQAVKVNSLGKWKTALQLSAMSAMLLLHKAERLAGNAPEVLDALHWGARASLGLLWAGAFLAVRRRMRP